MRCELFNCTSFIYGELAASFRLDGDNLNTSRNNLRIALLNLSQDKFRIGEYASVEEIANQILQTDLPFMKMRSICQNGYVCRDWAHQDMFMIETYS